MGGTTITCPICLMTYRIHYDYCDERDYEDSPFYLSNGKVYCKKCRLPAVGLWGLQEYAKEIYENITKFDSIRLNECIHKGYFAEAILMLHIQITNQLSFLLLRNLPNEKKEKEVKGFFEKSNSYSIINLGFLYNHINKEEFKDLIELNQMRNKFAHTFDQRKKWDFAEMRKIIDSSKKVEERLRKDFIK